MAKSRNTKRIIFAILVIAFIGFLDATYLTVKDSSGKPFQCSISNGGCNQVISSKYSTFYGVPVALVGIFYYLLIIILSIVFLKTNTAQVSLLFFLVAIGGFLASLRFLYLQFFIIKAVCFYCLISAGASISIFLLATSVLKYLYHPIKKVLP